ncbi:hypothetical protein [Magnetospirillum sp. ME-1]|uniref:hypothetical protein n=1 Tax=Magnetospirillum sp. ME-1 TaxID=1639348 RepID=UPI00143D156C|nr:hypothetical protein [Magnetospirillum sp. ME-1]
MDAATTYGVATRLTQCFNSQLGDPHMSVSGIAKIAAGVIVGMIAYEKFVRGKI